MAKNDNLHKAKDAKNDEFYTRIEDVAEELRHYKKHFAGKVVFCNCDDPTWSAFWRYFHLNFAELGLKKLISTHYDRTEPTYKMEYEGGDDNNVEVGVKTPLEGNGDFRNKECLDLLDESDIVVTNPPFSLFREYVGTLMERGKKFIIWGNNNAITYKEFFPLLKENRVSRSSSLTALGAMRSACPFVHLLSRRNSAPMSGKGISVPCALQMASTPSTPLRIWKVTTSFLGARAGIPLMTICRCCARNAIRQSRIIDVPLLFCAARIKLLVDKTGQPDWSIWKST